MKKKLLVTLGTLMMIALVGCGEQTEKYELETGDGTVTLEVKEDGDVKITEEKNDTPSADEFVYEEGTIPLGVYWKEGSNGAYWLKFKENSVLNNYVEIQDALISSTYVSGTYTYDEETKLYTIKNVSRVPFVITLYVDEADNYNLVITNIYYDKLEELDIDNGIYADKSQIDVKLKYERQ